MLEFIKKIFSFRSSNNVIASDKLIDKSPFLTPWYLDTNKPALVRDERQLNFKSESETITLNDDKNNCYGVIEIYSYILASDDGQSFVIWSRSLEKSTDLQTINLFCYNTLDLKKFDDKKKAIAGTKKNKYHFQFNCSPTAQISFEFDPNNSEQQVRFPEEFKKFKQTLLITELDNLYEKSNPDEYWHNTTILDLNFETGMIFNYPQDWFNKSNADFGYQWITRAIRNPNTKLIEGQGIRIDDFILNQSCRQLIK